MKRNVFYTLRRPNVWVTISGALMGVAFLIPLVYYLLIRSIVDVHIVELSIFMIAPMAVALLWCLTIHVLPLRNTTFVGLVAVLVFLLLIVYSLFYGDLTRTILCVSVCLVLSQAVIMILCGRFPYRLFASVPLLIYLVCRLAFYTYPVYLLQGRWEELILREVPGLCMLTAVFMIFGGIQAHKKEAQPKPGEALTAEYV